MKKRFFGIFLSLLLLFSSFTTCLAAEDSTDHASSEVIPFETLQNLFPDIPLREDGFIEGYSQNIMPYSSQDIKQIFASPVESYSTDYNGGLCTLNIYSNGAYGVSGYELIDEIAPLSEGFENQGGSKYRSYYTMMGDQGFSYTYNISAGQYSTISNLSPVSAQWGIANSYFEAGTSQYVRATQTTFASAEVYGEAGYYHMGYFNGTFRLITNVTSGLIKVSFTVL